MTFQIHTDLFEDFAFGFRKTLLSCRVAAIVIAEDIGMCGGEWRDDCGGGKRETQKSIQDDGKSRHPHHGREL